MYFPAHLPLFINHSLPRPREYRICWTVDPLCRRSTARRKNRKRASPCGAAFAIRRAAPLVDR